MSSRHFVPAFALASLSLLLGATPVRSATAATIQVTNCNDTGANSLRDAVARAASGDTVSMTSLACNRISLSHGPIVIAQDDLTLRGRDRTVTLHGRDTTQVLRHTGTGTLTIQGLVIAHGHNEGLQALGGCVYTAGNLDVRYSRIHHCVASGVGEDNVAAGGAVYVQRNALLSGSVLDDNAVTFDGPGVYEMRGGGGGAYAGGRLTAVHSNVVRNTTSGDGGGIRAYTMTARYANINDNHAANGGGFFIANVGSDPRYSTLANSTVARNYAEQETGAGRLGYGTLLVVNSTVSGNSASNESGLDLTYGDTDQITVANSTFAFNHDRVESTACEGVITFFDTLHLESTIVANNTCGSRPSDIEVDYHFSPVIVGANNLIGTSSVAVPADTISADPRLGSLANNGGSTPTHALLSDSPAIDKGNNVGGLRYDQRGPNFPRVKGNQADIGAFER